MCKKFNYSLSCGIKFIQHLKHFDHLVTVLGQATETMVRVGAASVPSVSTNLFIFCSGERLRLLLPRHLPGEGDLQSGPDVGCLAAPTSTLSIFCTTPTRPSPSELARDTSGTRSYCYSMLEVSMKIRMTSRSFFRFVGCSP